jgi:hypothetical protein
MSKASMIKNNGNQVYPLPVHTNKSKIFFFVIMRNKLTFCICKNGIFKIIYTVVKKRKKLRREKVTRRIFIMKRKFMRREEKNSL